VKLIDLNILLYAVNRDSPRHSQAKAWVERMFSGEESVALAWVVLLGFLRIATNGRVLPHPLAPEEAVDVVSGWLRQPPVCILHPGEEHWQVLTSLVAESGTAGNLTTDAHLAALAIENGCELCSTDSDFGRFRRVRWTNPLGT
jgi:toxin-antitoxin system PIN domain toxin